MHIPALAVTLVAALTFGGAHALTPARAIAAPQDAGVLMLPEPSALSEAMGNMGSAKRVLRDAVEAGDSAAALVALTAFQTNIVAAKAEHPPRAAKMGEAKKAAFVAGFRTALSELLRVTCELELALINGQLDKAKAILHDKLGDMEGAGHENFGGDDDG